MCPFGADFKHFREGKTEDFRLSGNASSIIKAKVLSIMQDNGARVTPP
jgi:hypothetical protein